jgi:hypothetical protein
VEGWETVLAAFGGLVLGLGLGMVFGRRHAQDADKAARRLRSRIRASVVPVLEGQALALGLSREERASQSEDPCDVAVDLSVSIQKFQDSHNMAFSDTLELSRSEAKGKE